MIKNDNDVLFLCDHMIGSINLDVLISLRDSINSKNYNSARYIVSGIKNNLDNSNPLINHIEEYNLENIENYLINKTEEEYDRGRI